jgi:outer membrane receptor protein involved in Fe transport
MTILKHYRSIVLIGILLAPLAALAAGGSMRFEIAAGDAANALSQFSQQSGLQMLFLKKAVVGHSTRAVSGELEPKAALAMLLEESGLTFEFMNERTVAIRDKEGESAGRDRAARVGSENLRLGQAEAAAENDGAITNAPDSSADAQGSPLEEIVVTAQKRVERLQDVPVPVTAISADTLVSTNRLRIQDYFTSVPGLSLTPSIAGQPQIMIRGVTSKFEENPTVGVVVDDVPISGSTSAGQGFLAPDIDPSNLARLEILRGPQGTLYGANSMGGLLKYVTVDPSTAGFSGRLQAGTTAVSGSSAVGYSLRGNVNVPLGNTWAVTGSAYTRTEPGYIDNHFTADPANAEDNDANRIDAEGGRLAALWQPSENFSLKLSALAQEERVKGLPLVDASLGDLQQSLLRGTGLVDKKSQVYIANLNAKLAGIDVVAVSGYSKNDRTATQDITGLLGDIAENGIPAAGIPGFGVRGVPSTNVNEQKKFTQEVRLSAPLGDRLEWLVGGFYTHEEADTHVNIFAADPATGETAGIVLINHLGPITYQEFAAFADLTVKLTNRFDVQFGGRQGHNHQSAGNELSGALVGDPTGTVFVGGTLKRASDDSFTYLVTPRFRISPDLMAYARVASGYRPGGSNGAISAFGFPDSYSPDKTQNYEIGVKGSLLNHRLSYDASVYYIEWKDMQLDLGDQTGVFAYTGNPGDAKSQGVELSMDAAPWTDVRISAWIAYNDAVLTEDFPPGAFFAHEDDRLPFTSRFSGSFSMDQEFPMALGLTGFIGGQVSYASDRFGGFRVRQFFGGPPISARGIYPAFARTDLRAGVKRDTWTASLFVNNVTDRRAIIAGGPTSGFGDTVFQYIQPRTIGLTVSKDF